MIDTKYKTVSNLLTIEHVNAMVGALDDTGSFVVVRDIWAGTVVVTGRKTGTEVYRAIEKGTGQPWIVTHIHDLFV